MIQNTNFTYNGLLNILNSFAQAHIDVRRFVAEDVDQMSEITSKEELFPMMFVAPINNIYDWQINQYEVRIYVYDRLLKDRSNINDIRSKTSQILSDLDVWLRKESELPIEISSISIAYPFSSELMTDVTGWYFDVVIDIPSYETCKIPFLNAPVISGFTCDVVYTNDYLTCQDLVDCPIIQDIQSDIVNIENILSGLTPDNFYTTGATLSGTTIFFDRNDLLNAYSVDISPALPNPSDYDELSELEDVKITGTTKGGSSLTYNTSTGFWEDKPITWTVELIDALTVDVYAPYNLSIDTIINVLNSPSITIQDDGVSYTLGNTISVGSKITITASVAGVINLIINKL